MWIFDAHLDLSMNAIEWNRDLTLPLEEIRRREAGKTDKRDRGRGVVSLPSMREGGIGICIATQIARYSGPGHPLPGWQSPEIAWAITQAQRSWYRALEEAGHLLQIRDSESLHRQVLRWQADPDATPIGYILSLEGADSILTFDHLERAYGEGLRALGPAHYGPGRYCPGTGEEGGFHPLGRELLREMERLGIVLDVTHLPDAAFWEAVEHFSGSVWASHNNCRALVPHQRQLSDDQLRALIERDAVIGAVCDAWMLSPGWVIGVTTPEEANVTLEHVVDQIDHVCQLAGNARHSGIGSDLDGGFGNEQCPRDLASIAGLSTIPGRLAARGYSPEDIDAIMHGNWVRRITEIWSGGTG